MLKFFGAVTVALVLSGTAVASLPEDDNFRMFYASSVQGVCTRVPSQAQPTCYQCGTLYRPELNACIQDCTKSKKTCVSVCEIAFGDNVQDCLVLSTKRRGY